MELAFLLMLLNVLLPLKFIGQKGCGYFGKVSNDFDFTFNIKVGIIYCKIRKR